jgi:hypothetical protein
MPTHKPIAPPADVHVHQRDDGRWQIGFHDDDVPSFETRAFAQAIAARTPTRAPQRRSIATNRSETP